MEPQHVVPGEREAADGWLAAQAAVRTVPVVLMNPRWQAGGSLPRMTIGPSIGPLAQGGLDKAFGFAIGLRSVIAGVQTLELVLLAHVNEELGVEYLAVVGQHPLDAYAKAAIVGQRVVQESGGTIGALSRPYLGKGHARVVIDGDVGDIVANATRSSRAVARDPVPHAADRSQALDIDVEQLPRRRSRVAIGRWRGSKAANRLSPALASTRDTVAIEISRVRAMLRIVCRCRRKLITRCAVPRAIAVGERCGRELRSDKPAVPAAAKRFRHLRTVCGRHQSVPPLPQPIHRSTRPEPCAVALPASLGHSYGCPLGPPGWV